MWANTLPLLDAQQPAGKKSESLHTSWLNFITLKRLLFMVRKVTASCGAFLLMRKIHREAGADLRPHACNSTSINYHKTGALSEEPQMQGFAKITARLSNSLFPNCPFFFYQESHYRCSESFPRSFLPIQCIHVQYCMLGIVFCQGYS